MESSSDDDGDPAAAGRFLLVLSCLVFCSQPVSTTSRKLPASHAAAPPAVAKVATKAPPKKAKPRSRAPKKLYITFDDGPNRGTRNVWTIVRSEGVPVSFFLVGEHVFGSPVQGALFDSLRSCPDVALCNHSYSHAHSHYQSYYQAPESVVADFRRTGDTLGLPNTIARTPGRNIWRIDSLRATDLKASTAAADSLQGAGFRLMGWDAEWEFDHKTFDVQQSAETLIRQLDSLFSRNKTKQPGHLVLLAHDQAFVKSADSLQLRLFLQALKKREDYELVLATEYPGAVKEGGMIAGR